MPLPFLDTGKPEKVLNIEKMYSKTCVAIAEVALPGTGVTGMWGRAGQRLTQVHQPKGECWDTK